MGRRVKKTRKMPRFKTPEHCPFESKVENVPTYLEFEKLAPFLTDRGKIIGKDRTGVSSKCQRALTKEIKRSRHLGLLPFAPVR